MMYLLSILLDLFIPSESFFDGMHRIYRNFKIFLTASSGIKGNFSLILLIFLSFSGMGMGSAIAGERIVTVGIYENAPKVFTADSGRPAGIFIDIIETIAKEESWRLRYVPGTWKEGLDRLARGEIDLMPDVAHTSDREKIFAFHKVPVLSSWFQVYAPKGSNIQSILDLKNKRILVLERSVQQEAFVRLSSGFDFKMTLIPVPDYKTMFETIAKGDADAAINNKFYGLMHAKKFGLIDTAVIFAPSNLFFATPKIDPKHLMAVIDHHLTELKNDSQSIYYQSLKKWTAEPIRFKLPEWVRLAGLIAGFLILTGLTGSILLKRQVNARTRELNKTNRALRTLSECNHAMVHSTNEAELLDAICRIVVDIGDYHIAWVCFAETETGGSIRLAASAGFEKSHPTTAGIKSPSIPGLNLAETAVRTGRPCPARYILTDPEFRSCRNEAAAAGYESALMLPLIDDGKVFGVLGIYSIAPDAFDTEEFSLLTELSKDLTFGILDHRLRVAHQQAEIQRQEAQQRFADIVEFLPDATFVVDQDKKIIAWNLACECMTGAQEDSLLGQGDYAYAEPFFGERRPILIDLLDRPMPEVEATYKYIKRQDDRVYGESFVPRLRKGQGAHLWGVASPLYDQHGQRYGAIQAIRDVTEQKQMEEVLRVNEKKYRELVMLANSIILRWTPDGRVTFLNEFGQKFFGYSEPEILGRHVVGTIVPGDETTGRDLRSLIADITADPKQFERNINENIRRNGERVWIDWTNKTVFDEQGRIKEILSIGSDITEHKNAEEQIHRLNDELRRHAEILEQRVAERTAELIVAKDKAESADRIKSAFLATMSHELRTPLNSIIGFTGILLQGLAGPLNEEQQKQMTMVQSSARHLLSLINDVLDISKIEAGQLELSVKSFELKPSIEKIVKLVSPLAQKKGIDLQLNISDDVDTITTDQRRLEQILVNLLNNAVKFTETGYVRLSCRTDAENSVMVVSDTGIGIQRKDLPALFQPFRQIDAGTTRKHEGSGLGLSICKKLMDIIGGTIEVESQWGKGSRFTVRIPKQTGDVT